MIHGDKVTLQFGHRILFYDASFAFTPKNRYAIVGGNGAGKSSLLRAIAGEITLTSGSISMPAKAKLGWLKQDQHLYDQESVIDVVMMGRKDLWELQQLKDQLLGQEDWTDEVSYRFSELEERFNNLGGYQAASQAQTILEGLGIHTSQHKNKLSSFSGGWKLRILLARVLFTNPEIMLLDEPTNYLDVKSISWLESFLISQYKGLLVIVSHDQTFINRVATHIIDIDYGQIRSYTGNFDRFLVEKAANEKLLLKKISLLEDQAKQLKDFIARFKSKPSKAAQCASKAKMLERLEWPEVTQSNRRAPNFRFTQEQKSARSVCKVSRLSKKYDSNEVLLPCDLTIFRGDRIAVAGPNGSGKSTLLQLLCQQIEATTGQVEYGLNVSTDFFLQEHRHLFNEGKSLLDWLSQASMIWDEQKIKQMAGRLLFSESDFNKSPQILSGGEMARLLIGKIMMLKKNFLLLDEPTNHLDLESIEALGNAVQSFDGTILCVSHDRHFIKQIATRLWYVEEGIVEEHPLENLEELIRE